MISKIKILASTIIFFGTAAASTASAQDYAPRWGEWDRWGDCGDGTYRNPVIPSDYSDLDCIRVGKEYYAITSTFQFSPGITILRSEDLVNWTICGHAVPDITQIGPELNWDRMNRYGKGIWAGTLRYHGGRFYIFFGTPDEGFFMTSARKPEGPWEPLTQLMETGGWDDCTVMWDSDGRAYFVGTHFADGYRTYLFDMAPDGKTIDTASARLINEGSGREASKLLKVGDWYYLIFSEHQWDKGRYVMAKRAKSITGPYDEERVLAPARRQYNEPNQGGIVEGPDGNWYFLTHHGTGDWGGRVASLLPVTWTDGWPMIGNTGEDAENMTWSAPMPCVGKKRHEIQTSDDFGSRRLGPQWQWNYQPRADKFSLTERKGWLRLKAFAALQPGKLLYAGNTLTQRCFRTRHSQVTVEMDISGMADGQRNGLCHFSSQSAAIGIVKDGGKCYVEFRRDDACTRGNSVPDGCVWLRSEWGLDGVSKFSYSLDGRTFIPFGEEYTLCWGHYRGDRIGIYCFNDKAESGYVDVDMFSYDMKR